MEQKKILSRCPLFSGLTEAEMGAVLREMQVKEKDYEKSIGRMIEIKLFSPVDKSKEYSGVLKEYDKDTVTISIDDVTKTFDRSNLAMIRWAFVDEV